ncbi:MAG: SH3 domain-containing protein [Anaerolineae bacterium]|nr:SH3 domain-containing protein [Anaerolineae bacterium]
MRKRSLWWGWGIALGLVVLSTSAVLAAPDQLVGYQITPTAETPTPTLPPPPSGRGLVTARVLVQRAGPSIHYPKLGGLPYGSEVIPLAQSTSGNWVMIKRNDSTAWVWKGFVAWDPNLNLDELTVITLTPSLTPENTYTPTTTRTPVPTRTPAPTNTPTPEPPTPSDSTGAQIPTPEPPPTAMATATSEPVVIPTAAPESKSIQDFLADLNPPWLWIGIVAGALFLSGYVWRLVSGRSELKRYAEGFSLKTCPVCQTGRLHLVESEQRVLGITRVLRLVRCDTCRSVLRQVKPGTWRYSIDPIVNPGLADSFNNKTFSDSALIQFATRARTFQAEIETEPDFSESSAFQSVIEHLEELEAAVIAKQEEDAARAEEEARKAAEEALKKEQEGTEAGESDPPEEETDPGE